MLPTKGDWAALPGLISGVGEKFGVVKAVVYGVFDGGTENGELTLLAASPLQLTEGGMGEY